VLLYTSCIDRRVFVRYPIIWPLKKVVLSLVQSPTSTVFAIWLLGTSILLALSVQMRLFCHACALTRYVQHSFETVADWVDWPCLVYKVTRIEQDIASYSQGLWSRNRYNITLMWDCCFSTPTLNLHHLLYYSLHALHYHLTHCTKPSSLHHIDKVHCVSKTYHLWLAIILKYATPLW